MTKDDYEQAAYIAQFENVGRLRNEFDQTLGDPILFGSAAGEYDQPPYDNNGARYDFPDD